MNDDAALSAAAEAGLRAADADPTGGVPHDRAMAWLEAVAVGKKTVKPPWR